MYARQVISEKSLRSIPEITQGFEFRVHAFFCVFRGKNILNYGKIYVVGIGPEESSI
jgi:hypothetical protein